MLLFACLLSACGCDRAAPASSAPDAENSVAAFMKNADRQSETDGQRREIRRALRDMLDMPPAELKRARYADYAGQPNSWSITQLLRHYFVANPPVALDEQRFYQDVGAPAARAAIEHQLQEVERAL